MVDDSIIPRPPSVTHRIIADIDVQVKLGRISHGAGLPRFFRLNLRQDEYFAIFVHGDGKLEALSVPHIFSQRHLQQLNTLNSIECGWLPP